MVIKVLDEIIKGTRKLDSWAYSRRVNKFALFWEERLRIFYTYLDNPNSFITKTVQSHSRVYTNNGFYLPKIIKILSDNFFFIGWDEFNRSFIVRKYVNTKGEKIALETAFNDAENIEFDTNDQTILLLSLIIDQEWQKSQESRFVLYSNGYKTYTTLRKLTELDTEGFQVISSLESKESHTYKRGDDNTCSISNYHRYILKYQDKKIYSPLLENILPKDEFSSYYHYSYYEPLGDDGVIMENHANEVELTDLIKDRIRLIKNILL